MYAKILVKMISVTKELQYLMKKLPVKFLHHTVRIKTELFTSFLLGTPQW